MSTDAERRYASARQQWGALLAELQSQFVGLDSGRWQHIERCQETELVRLLETNAHRIVDGPSERNVEWSCLVLAAYRALCAELGDTSAVLDGMRRALTARTRREIVPYLTARFGIDPERPDEAFTRVAENFKPRGEERFGRAFIYEQDVLDEARSFVNIRRCLFNDFFRANGSPEVTPLFCALDYVWAEEMEQGKYGVRFDRPTTLAGGGDMCRFQFSRSEPAG